MTEQLKPPFHVKAIAPYTASSATELSLTVGLELEVLGTDGRGVWWQAQKPDGSGIAWFPASYVQVVESQPALPPPPVVTSTKTSQLNLAASVSNDANLSAPQSARSLTGSGSGKEKKKKSSASSTNGKKKKKSGTKKKKAAQERPPEPSKPLRAEKGTTPCSVKIQLVSAELKAEVSKEVPSPAAFLYMREVLGDKDGRKAFATAKLKKTLEPNWNEAFQLDVTDAESEIVAVRVCSGDKPTTSKGKYYGEVTFPLRGAVRDFDSPSYQYKWCDLLLDNKEVGGRIRVFIQYIDTRVTSAPTNFKHESHVGWTADGGFDISNIPGDWKELFKSIGLTKHDLQENSSLAKEVFEIMNNANALPLPPDPIDPALLPAPLPLPVTSGIADLPLPPPPMPGPGLGAPTPMPLAGGAAPPPPPPPPPAPANNNSTAPPPPPQPSGNVSSSGPRSSFLDDVKKGAVLRPVAREQAATPNAPGGDVTSVLKLAMERHRKAMAEMPEPSGGGDGDWSDWSEDDDEDEDQGDE